MTRRIVYTSPPEKPFRVGTLQWNLDNVANHVRAGFEGVSDETVRVHYYRYLAFLQDCRYTVREFVGSLDDVDSETALWSNDLTPVGYRFVQISHDRWVGRILKYVDSSQENAYLPRWRARFLELPASTFDA